MGNVNSYSVGQRIPRRIRLEGLRGSTLNSSSRLSGGKVLIVAEHVYTGQGVDLRRKSVAYVFQMHIANIALIKRMLDNGKLLYGNCCMMLEVHEELMWRDMGAGNQRNVM